MSQLCSTSVETDALHFMSRRGLQAFKPGLLKHMVVSVRGKIESASWTQAVVLLSTTTGQGWGAQVPDLQHMHRDDQAGARLMDQTTKTNTIG